MQYITPYHGQTPLKLYWNELHNSEHTYVDYV